MKSFKEIQQTLESVTVTDNNTVHEETPVVRVGFLDVKIGNAFLLSGTEYVKESKNTFSDTEGKKYYFTCDMDDFTVTEVSKDAMKRAVDKADAQFRSKANYPQLVSKAQSWYKSLKDKDEKLHGFYFTDKPDSIVSRKSVVYMAGAAEKNGRVEIYVIANGQGQPGQLTGTFSVKANDFKTMINNSDLILSDKDVVKKSVSLHEGKMRLSYDMALKGKLMKGTEWYAVNGRLYKLDHDNKRITDYGKLKDPKATAVLKEEDAPPTNVSSGVAKKDQPLGDPARRKKFAGCDVFEVDSDTFHKCKLGKGRYERYSKYFDVETEGVGKDIHSAAKSGPRKPIIVQDNKSGSMLYLKFKHPTAK